MTTDETHYIASGFAALEQQRLDEAQRYFEVALSIAPASVEAMEALAVLAHQAGDVAKARQYWAQAIALAPSQASLYLGLGNTLIASGELALAKTTLQQALSLESTYPAALNSLASCYLREQNFASALVYLQQALLHLPSFEAAQYNLAQALFQLGRLDEAHAMLTTITVQHPPAIKAYLQLGHIAMLQQQYAQAVPCYQTVLAAVPDHADALNNLAACYMAQQQAQAALECLAKGLAQRPDDLHIRANMAAAFLELKRFDQALYHYDICLEKGYLDDTLHYNRAVAMMSQGRLSEAITLFKTVIQQQATHVAAWTNLGASYLKSDQRAAAAQAYAQAHALAPDDPTITYMHAVLNETDKPAQAPAQYIENLYDNYAEYYDKHLTDTLRYTVPAVISQRLRAYLQPALPVLDLGCGTGLCGEQLRDTGIVLSGVDLSARMLAKARERDCYAQLHQMEMLAYLQHHPNIRWPVILIADALLYVGDLSALFVALAQALIPEGILAFTTEYGETDGFTLRESGRFTHHPDYVRETAKQVGLVLLDEETVTLRQQSHQPVKGHLWIYQRQA